MKTGSQSHKRAIVAISANQARIWSSGLERGTDPHIVRAPDEKGMHHHVRQGQHHGGHSSDPAEKGFFDQLGRELSDVGEILLIGHGIGKANAMARFIDFMKAHNAPVAGAILGTIEADLKALTDNEILARGRNWFDWYHREGLPVREFSRGYGQHHSNHSDI